MTAPGAGPNVTPLGLRELADEVQWQHGEDPGSLSGLCFTCRTSFPCSTFALVVQARAAAHALETREQRAQELQARIDGQDEILAMYRASVLEWRAALGSAAEGGAAQ